VFVYSIATGEGEYKDVWSSFYGKLIVPAGHASRRVTQQHWFCRPTAFSACSLTHAPCRLDLGTEGGSVLGCTP
jgi:hypothetical protein